MRPDRPKPPKGGLWFGTKLPHRSGIDASSFVMLNEIMNAHAELLCKALMWKAAQLEERAINQSTISALPIRAHAQFLREKVSQLKGERILTRDDGNQRLMVLSAVAEYELSLKEGVG